VGGRLYVGEWGSVLVLGLEDPLAPEPLGRWLPDRGEWTSVEASQDRLYVLESNYAGDDGSALHLVDTSFQSDPGQLAILTSRVTLTTTTTARSITAAGDLLLVGAQDGLHAVDAAQPDTLRALNDARATRGWAGAVVVAADVAYVDDSYRGLRTLDLSRPEAPQWIGEARSDCPGPTLWPCQLLAVGGEGSLFTSASFDVNRPALEVWDIRQPGAPQRLAQLPNEIGPVNSLAATGHFAFLGYSADHDGVVVVDASVPRQPHEVARITDVPGGRSMAIGGGYLFVSGEPGLLMAFDIHDPVRPGPPSAVRTGPSFGGLALDGSYAYLTTLDRGLVVVDVHDPSAMRVVSTIGPGIQLTTVAASGGIAYVGDHGGLRVVDARTPAAPLELATLRTPTPVIDVAVMGHYVVVNHGDGLLVVDVTNAANPRVVGRLRLPG
jgi:hypothetical protein